VLIWKYYCYQATLSEGFVYPIITLYLLSRGLSEGDVGLVNGLFFVGVVGAEIPTGYVGDKLGRRSSLILSAVCMTISLLAFTVSQSVLAFSVVFVFWGIALTFRSGSGSAYLYDMLDERLDTDEFAAITGRGGAAFLFTSAITSIAGSALYTIDRRLPFVAAALVTGSGVFVLRSMPRTDQYAEGEGGDAFAARKAWETIREKLLGPELRWFIVYTALLLSIPELADLYIQPIVVDAGVPEAWLGVLYAVFMLLTAIASYNVDRVRGALGIASWLRVAPLLMLAVLAGMLVTPWLAIPGFVGMRVVKQLSHAFQGQYLNDRLPSLGRATILSTASMVYGISYAVFRVGGGALADAVGAKLAIVGLTVFVAVVTALLQLAGRPIEDDS
jgi:MFS family permease